jgi:hypothetical protein
VSANLPAYLVIIMSLNVYSFIKNAAEETQLFIAWKY